MNYLGIFLFLIAAMVSCGSSEGDQDGDTSGDDEYVRIVFEKGVHKGVEMDGVIGVRILEQLKAVDAYSTNQLLASDKTTFSIIKVTINHVGESTGTFALSDHADAISAEGNSIVLGNLDINNANTTLTSADGELVITAYDAYYEGSFAGEFLDEKAGKHKIEGEFRVEI